jgi:hypothetical protein
VNRSLAFNRWFLMLPGAALFFFGVSACDRISALKSPPARYELVAERSLNEKSWDDFQWSPDGSRLLLWKSEFLDGNGGQQPQLPLIAVDGPVTIRDIESGSMRTLPHGGLKAMWSPDGQFVLLRSRAEAQEAESYWLYRVKDGVISPLPGFPADVGTWTEAGLTYFTKDGLWRTEIEGLKTGDPSSGNYSWSQLVKLLSYNAGDSGQWASPAPNLKTFLLNDESDLEHRRWWLVQTDGTRLEMPYPLYGLGICCRWSPDGGRLAFFGRAPEPSLYIVGSRGENLHQLVTSGQIRSQSGGQNNEGAFISLDFSPDGRVIAFQWSDGGEGFPFERSRIFVVGVDGRGLQEVAAAPERARNYLRWSPDGRYMAYFGKGHSVWIAEVRSK